jgi:hypothetical protein
VTQDNPTPLWRLDKVVRLPPLKRDPAIVLAEPSLRKHRINRRRFQVGGLGAIWLEACHFRSRYRQLNILFALGVIAALCWLGQHYRIEVLSYV